MATLAASPLCCISPRKLSFLRRALNLLLLSALLLPQLSLGHSASTAFLRLAEQPSGLKLRLDLSLADSASIAPVDINNDQQITWGELSDARFAIAERLKRDLKLTRGNSACIWQSLQLAMTEHSAEPYAVFKLDYVCAQDGELTLDYNLLFDRDSNHRALLQIGTGNDLNTALLSPQQRRLQIPPGGHSSATPFASFWREGVLHILGGYDHLLFLATLLLPCVLVYRQRRWQPCDSARPALLRVLAVVTAFTCGHSITLGLVMLGYVPHPGAWIETAIAVSIVLAALNNLTPRLPLPGALLAASLGLLHGFGFASALSGIGVNGGQVLLPLLSFNLGVESGQLLVVAALLPLLLMLRRKPFYRTAVVGAGSCCAAAAGGIWTLQTLGLLGPLLP